LTKTVFILPLPIHTLIKNLHRNTLIDFGNDRHQRIDRQADSTPSAPNNPTFIGLRFLQITSKSPYRLTTEGEKSLRWTKHLLTCLVQRFRKKN